MKKSVLVLMIFTSLTIISIAQTPPHPNGGSAPGSGNTPVGGGAPIDGGAAILLALSVFYAINRFRNSIQLIEKQDENN